MATAAVETAAAARWAVEVMAMVGWVEAVLATVAAATVAVTVTEVEGAAEGPKVEAVKVAVTPVVSMVVCALRLL